MTFFEFLRDDVILIGRSLGAIFLAKYLSENEFPKKIKSVYLIAAPFDDSLPDEDLAGGFELQDDLEKLNNLKPILMFSQDDPVVPLDQVEKYKQHLPDAKIFIYENKNGHFQVPEFPELVELIKKTN